MTHFDYQGYFEQKLDTLRQKNCFRTPQGSNRLVNFASNDYLGLANHPQLIKASIDSANKYGIGTGSSKYISGYSELHKLLEAKLASLKQTEDAVLYGAGYLACLGVLACLAGKNDVILADKFIHASLLDGCFLSGAKLIRFAHNDTDNLRMLITQNRHKYQKALIVTETVFSMHGDISPLSDIIDIAKEFNCILVSDDAHGFGVIKLTTPDYPLHVKVGTLSKAVGVYGGYVCSTGTIADYVRNFSRSQFFTTSLPFPIVSACLEALEIIQNQGDEMRNELAKKIKFFSSELGYSGHFHAPIIMLQTQNEVNAINISKLLMADGFFVPAIRPPTVPVASLRITICQYHTYEHLSKLAESIKKHYPAI